MLADLLMLSTKSPAFYKCNNTTFIGSTVTPCTNTAAQTVSNRKAFQNAGKIIAEENELKYLRPQPKVFQQTQNSGTATRLPLALPPR